MVGWVGGWVGGWSEKMTIMLASSPVELWSELGLSLAKVARLILNIFRAGATQNGEGC